MALNVLSAESRFGPIGPYLKWTWHTRESLGSKLRKKLKELLTKVFVTNTRGVKIIHGSGRTTGRSVIRGGAIDLLRELAQRTGGRLVQDNGNPGAHILWLNR